MEYIQELKDKDDFQVVVRCQPLINKLTLQVKPEKEEQVLFVNKEQNAITARFETEMKDIQQYVFPFYKVFSPESTQSEVYSSITEPLVKNALEGYNVNFILYGQQFSSKRYTVFGNQPLDNDMDNKGFICRCSDQIFDHIQQNPQIKYIIKLSMCDIYMEEISDLIKRSNRHLKKEEQLKELLVTNKQQLIKSIKEGRMYSMVLDTRMGRNCRRMCTVVQLTIERVGSTQSQIDNFVSHLKFITLPRTNRVKEEEEQKNPSRFKEAISINKGITTFENIINGMTSEHKVCIDYDDSIVTSFLKNSLGGNSKTLLLVTVAIGSFNLKESLFNLRFASRAKSIKNSAKVNKVIKEPPKASRPPSKALFIKNQAQTDKY